VLVTVLTCDRLGGASFLEATLAHFTPDLLRHGFPGVVFSDGRKPLPAVPEAWTVDEHEGEQWGNRKMLGRILTHFVTRTDEERLLYLEDDVIACRNFFALAAGLALPDDLPLVSFHDPRRAPKERPSLTRLPLGDFLYMQAMVVTRRAAEGLLGVGVFDVHPVAGRNACDALLRKNLLKLGYADSGLIVPNPVRHTGDVSAVWSGPTHVPPAPAYPGDEVDCAAWLREL
jgi:hypothetical protein